MFAPDEQWIDAFTEAVWETMRRCRCLPNSCIEAACIGVGVAAPYGFLVEPVPVRVHVQAGNEVTVVPGPAGRRPRASDEGFAGHLVLHFPAAGMLVDLTAPQFDSPARGIRVPEPLSLSARREALTVGVGGDLGNGTMIAYQELVGNVAWRTLPAWTGSSAVTIGIAGRALRERLSVAKSRRPARRS